MTLSLTREQFERARLKLADQGIIVKGDEGEISHDTPFGTIRLAFSFDGQGDAADAAGRLVVTVEHKPFMVAESLVESKVTEWFQDI
jgi:hypothetical protein